MNQLYSLKVAKRAQEELQGIWQYTLDKWGQEQAESYLQALENAFHRLLTHPESGYRRPDIFSGCHHLKVRKHLVFYTIAGDYVEVLAVLHQQMDCTRCFFDK